MNISVVIPAYNASAYLEECVLSIMEQRLKPREVIIVNDGSVDNTLDVANRLKDRYQAITVISQENRGESVARNVGLTLAKSEYIHFMDADDVITRDFYSTVAGAMEAGPKRDVVVVGHGQFRGNVGNIIREDIPLFDDFILEVIGKNPAPPIAWLFSRSVVERIGGFREDLDASEDWEFVVRTALSGAEHLSIGKVCAYRRLHNRSQVSTMGLRKIRIGHVCVKTTLCKQLLRRPELLTRYAEPSFWSCWVTVANAKSAGVSWTELSDLGLVLKQLTNAAPGLAKRSRLARLVASTSIRWAYYLSMMNVVRIKERSCQNLLRS